MSFPAGTAGVMVTFGACVQRRHLIPEIKVWEYKLISSPCWEVIIVSPVSVVTVSAWGMEIISLKNCKMYKLLEALVVIN